MRRFSEPMRSPSDSPLTGRQTSCLNSSWIGSSPNSGIHVLLPSSKRGSSGNRVGESNGKCGLKPHGYWAVSYTHLRAHETRHDLVCRLLLEKKKTKVKKPQQGLLTSKLIQKYEHTKLHK